MNNASTIVIVSDGTRTAVLLNDQYLQTAERIAFTANGGDSAQLDVALSLAHLPTSGEQERFWEMARDILGYEMRDK